MNGLGWIGRDVRDAVRSLLRDRGSVALALLALSLGIGATAVIFSVVYSVLVNTFPFENPSRVVHFYIQAPNQPGRSAWYPAPEFVDYRAQNRVFSAVLGGASFEALYNLENATYRVRGALIDPHAPSALGVRPVLGRTMTDADGAPGAPPTFLMSDRLWKERFNRDPHVIGTTLKINGTYRTLIAVLPPRFLLHGADVFFPATITAESTATLIGGPAAQPLFVWTYAVLKPGVTKEQAAANVDVIAHNQARLYPDIVEDGRIGQNTLATFRRYLAARGTDASKVMVAALNCDQGERYKELARARASNETFVYGWLRQRVAA